jgi:tRNA dimethylallyltransferase
VIPLLAVVGPTASGKTSLAIAVAERLRSQGREAEIISADSMQVYRGMEIGTAAPTPEEQARVRHHFVGFLDPGEYFSAGEFEQRARRVVGALHEVGKGAIVVGGSGLYVQALIDGLFPGPQADDSLRARLEDEAQERGTGTLYARLQGLDPEYAGVINRGDLRRIVRALEVHELTGRCISELHQEHRDNAAPLPAVQVALDYPRDQLYARIDARVDRILERGFLDEVRALADRGYEVHLERLRTLGYREFMAYLRSEQTYEQAADAMKQNTRRFAKRQLTWFRADERIRWLPTDSATPPQAHADAVLALMQRP